MFSKSDPKRANKIFGGKGCIVEEDILERILNENGYFYSEESVDNFQEFMPVG